MKRKWGFVVVMITAVFLAGCSNRAAEISCTAEWRTDISIDVEERDTLVLRDMETSGSMTLGDLTFNAEYQPGSDVRTRSLRIWITPPIGSPDLLEQVYELPPDGGPTDQFINDRGFTGLTLFYNPDPNSDSILQYWCSVSG